jgi:hypothetical protein
VKRSPKVVEIKYRGAIPIDSERVTNVFLFRGWLNEAGYEWLSGDDGKPRLVPQRGTGYRRYNAPPGLFLGFSELNPTKKSVREFADKYGDIFSRYDVVQSAARKDGTISHGTSLGSWAKEIADMKAIVELWNQIENQQLSELAKIIWRTGEAVGYEIATPRRKAWHILAHVDIGEGLGRLNEKDVLFPARCALQLEINKRIADNAPVPRLAWTPDHHQRIILDPPNLLSAMWMQFAQEMIGQFRLVLCACGCGRYFQTGPGARKSHTKTFDAACRKRLSRNQ